MFSWPSALFSWKKLIVFIVRKHCMVWTSSEGSSEGWTSLMLTRLSPTILGPRYVSSWRPAKSKKDTKSFAGQLGHQHSLPGGDPRGALRIMTSLIIMMASIIRIMMMLIIIESSWRYVYKQWQRWRPPCSCLRTVEGAGAAVGTILIAWWESWPLFANAV